MADKDKDKNNQLNLGCLEEDDEFEEFPVEGLLWAFACFLFECSTSAQSTAAFRFAFIDLIRLFSLYIHPKSNSFSSSISAEWADGKENEDEVNVWEDNWDDDNVEDDFNNQLRAQLESQKK